MKTLNKVILLGHLGNSPEKRVTKNGVTRATFPVATHHRFKKKKPEGESALDSSESTDESDTEMSEVTQWHQIVTWGTQAEHCIQYLTKGSPVLVEGSIRSRSWETDDGEKKYFVEIQADQVSFLPAK